MFGCCDHDRIDVALLLIEHDPKVFVFRDIRELSIEAYDSAITILFGFNVACKIGIHITEGSHLDSARLEHLDNDKGPVSTGSYNSDVDQVAWGCLAKHVPGNDRKRSGCCCANEFTSCDDRCRICLRLFFMKRISFAK